MAAFRRWDMNLTGDGATLEQARSEVKKIARQLEAEYPDAGV